MTKTPKIINVFCSVSLKRMEEVNNLLIPSLEEQKTNYEIQLYLINYVADNSVTEQDIKRNNISVHILNPIEPLGFGESHNFAFTTIKPKGFFIIINPDIQLDSKCIDELIKSFTNETGLIEARQLPFAHPKDTTYKEVFETNWASGCCLLINSEFFKSVKGFDPNYWMYLEDVDLSWKAWINRYKVLQNPKAVAYHYTGIYFKYNQNSYEIEDFWSMRNFFYISYLYFGKNGLKRAKKIAKETAYHEEFIEEAYLNFEKLINKKKPQRIRVPSIYKNRIQIYGYNKFSEYPK